MNFFVRLPVTIRLLVVTAFLAVSIVVGVLGRPSRVLLLVAALLFLGGGWRISKARGLVLILILVPAIVGLLMTHFDWHHPFLTRYSAGLFSVIAALLIMDGIRIEEWVRLLNRENGFSPRGLLPILIGTAVGTISLSSNIREQRNCRKLARIQAWQTKSKASLFLDGIALPFYSAVESHEFIDEALRRWGTHDRGRTLLQGAPGSPPELNFGNSSFIAGLSDLNDFPFLRDLQADVFAAAPFPEPWTRAIGRVKNTATVLEIGDHSGKFTKFLMAKGFPVSSLTSLAVGRGSQGFLQPPSRPKNEVGSRLDKPDFHCEHIFFHHDCFLEAVNQTGLHQLLTRLHEISPAGAFICFEYPVEVMHMPEGTILSAYVQNLGQVDFRYSDHRQNRGTHQLRLDYNVRQEHDSVCIRVPLRFIAPELSEVIAEAADVGFACTTCPIDGALSFLGERISFVQLQRSDCLAGQ